MFFINKIYLLIPLAFLLFADGLALGEEPLKIGRMMVAVRPEYDDSGVLAIYDGRFADSSAFPTETSFLLPKGAMISDACSLSPRGQHFCQLYKIVEGEDGDKITLKLPYSNFYLSFHLPPFDDDKDKRDFGYLVKASHPIDLLEVNFQQPLRSTEFEVSPAGGKQFVDKGFNHLSYTFKDVAQGENKAFNVSYIKKDRKPSVDIRYANKGMDGSEILPSGASPYSTQRKIKWFIYIVFGAGLVSFVTASWIIFSKSSWFKLSKKKRAKKKKA